MEWREIKVGYEAHYFHVFSFIVSCYCLLFLSCLSWFGLCSILFCCLFSCKAEGSSVLALVALHWWNYMQMLFCSTHNWISLDFAKHKTNLFKPHKLGFGCPTKSCFLWFEICRRKHYYFNIFLYWWRSFIWVFEVAERKMTDGGEAKTNYLPKCLKSWCKVEEEKLFFSQKGTRERATGCMGILSHKAFMSDQS